MNPVKLIVSFHDNYSVTTVTDGTKKPVKVVNYISNPEGSDHITFGTPRRGTPKERAMLFAKALQKNDWEEFDRGEQVTSRPQQGQAFYQFLKHKLTLIYEDAGHLIYQAK